MNDEMSVRCLLKIVHVQKKSSFFEKFEENFELLKSALENMLIFTEKIKPLPLIYP